MERVGVIHGVGIWFDVYFSGSTYCSLLSTSPFELPTRWKQMRLLLSKPIGINPDQIISGNLKMGVNEDGTIDVELILKVPELNVIST